jgi:thioesterase DpgC
VNKLFRGLSSDEFRPDEPEQTTEKLWVAAVETFAIGGACQILHTVDHVIAARGSRLFLPARKEGILPGASNLRLARSVGDRIARRAILSGLEFEAGTPHGDLLVDEVVEDSSVQRHRERFDKIWEIAATVEDTVEYVSGRIKELEAAIRNANKP